MEAISEAGEMLKIINDRTNIQAKIEIAQKSGNKSEEKKYKEELINIHKAAKELAPRIG